MAYIYAHLTVKTFAEALKKNQTVILPIAVVEQHGFHLPLNTDILNVDEVLKRAESRLDCFIAPTIPYAYSAGELPGTINVSPLVFANYVAEIVKELFRNGFKNVVLFLGHGGTDNEGSLNLALRMIYKQFPFYRDRLIALFPCWLGSETWMKYFNGNPPDFHAGLVETSLIKYWHPELVGEIEMDDPVTAKNMLIDQDWFEDAQKEFDHPFVVRKNIQRPEIRVGVMGNPHASTPEIGKILSTEVENSLVDFIDKINNR